MAGGKSKSFYTLTDEAPLLATCAFCPIIRTFTGPAGIEIEKADISVSARVLAEFPTPAGMTSVPNTLASWAKVPAAGHQHHQAAEHLRFRGPAEGLRQGTAGNGATSIPISGNRQTDEEKALKARYGKCLGSGGQPGAARRQLRPPRPGAVKNYAQEHPHSMGEWKQWSQTHVSHMHGGDFYHGEKSMTLDKAARSAHGTDRQGRQDHRAQAEAVAARRRDHRFHVHEQEGAVRLLRKGTGRLPRGRHPVLAARQGDDDEGFAPDRLRPLRQDLLQGRLREARKTVQELGINVNNGMVDLYEKIKSCRNPSATRSSVTCTPARSTVRAGHGRLGQGHHQLPFAERHVIVDASMPAMIRQGGKMWGADGKQYDCKAVMPESTFARIYQEMINFCKWHGNFDPKTMGTVAQRRPDGPAGRRIRLARQDLRNRRGRHRQHRRYRHRRSAADAKRRSRATSGACARSRTPRSATGSSWPSPARHSGMPAVFWLDPYRPHENELIKKVNAYLKDHDTTGPTSRS